MNHAEELAQLIARLLARHRGSVIATGPRVLILVEGSGTENADAGSGKLLIQVAFAADLAGDAPEAQVIVQVCIDQGGHWVPYVEGDLRSGESVFAELDLTHGQLTVTEPEAKEEPSDPIHTTPVDTTRRSKATKRRPRWPEPTTEEPDLETLEEWLIDDGGCEATDSCWVEVDGICQHGHPSWLLRLGLI